MSYLREVKRLRKRVVTLSKLSLMGSEVSSDRQNRKYEEKD